MRIRILIVLLIGLYSCGKKATNQTNDTSSIKTIDIFSASDSVVSSLSYLASDIEYVQLKTPENIHFNSIFKIVSNSDKIYINAGNDLICFDNNGAFLYNLSRRNQEREESSDFIFDFDISTDDKTLVVLSTGRILFFNNTGTEFVFQKLIILNRPWPSKIDLVPETNNILLSIRLLKGSEHLLNILINDDGDTLSYRSNYYRYRIWSILSEKIILYKTGNYLCFKEPLNDTVFYVNTKSNDFKPRVIIDAKGKTYTHLVKRDGIYRNPELNEYSFVNSIFEVSGFIFYDYSYYYLNMIDPKTDGPFEISRRIIYDSLTNKKFEIPNSELKEDLCGGPDFKLSSGSEGKLYSSAYALTLKKHAESESFTKATVQIPLKKEKLKKLADSLTENDNPVLIIVTLKTSNSITNSRSF